MSTERGVMGIRGDATKASWEDSSFPIVCETCLGDNPYVRMQRQKFGQACKICERPFTVFRWRPGGVARYKKTQLCQTCSKTKNVCQVCILDLTYGLPVQVRDKLLAQQQQLTVSVPQGAANQAYFFSQQATLAENGDALGNVYNNPSAATGSAHAALMRMARKKPYYKRNLPHVCSFYVKGECNRGSSCPYRHEMPPTKKDDPLAQQNMRDRFNGVDDPVANKMLSKMSDRSRIRQPADDTITTVWVGGVDASKISDGDLRDVFYHFGEVRLVKMLPEKSCAFVEFVTHEQAEAAIKRKHGNCIVRGISLAVNWANRGKHGGIEGPPRHVHTGGYVTRDGAAAPQSQPVAAITAGDGNSAPPPAIPDAFVPAAGVGAGAPAGAQSAPVAAAAAPRKGPLYPSMSSSMMGSR